MKNPLKVLLIVTMLLVIVLLTVVLFKKDKIVLEDEQGNTFVGFAGKIGIKPELLDEN